MDLLTKINLLEPSKEEFENGDWKKYHLDIDHWVNLLGYRKTIDEEIAECNLHMNGNLEKLESFKEKYLKKFRK